jgi:hypothetical protein
VEANGVNTWYDERELIVELRVPHPAIPQSDPRAAFHLPPVTFANP